MKRKYELVDDNGFIIEPIVLEEVPKVEVDGEMVEDKHYISKKCPGGFYTPKFNFETEKWEEGVTQAEIDSILEEQANRPPTTKERLEEVEKSIGANGKTASKGMAQRLDKIEEDIARIKTELGI